MKTTSKTRRTAGLIAGLLAALAPAVLPAQMPTGPIEQQRGTRAGERIPTRTRDLDPPPVRLDASRMGRQPPGWLTAGPGSKGYEMGLAPGAGRNGSTAFRVRSIDRQNRNAFLGVMQQIDGGPWAGQRVRLSAWLRTRDVRGRVGLFLRAYDGDRRMVAFDNMDSRPVRGTAGWRRYEVVVDVPEDAGEVAFGVFLGFGSGEVWVDDFHLDRVGPAVGTTAPPWAGVEQAPRRRDPSESSSDWLLGGSAPDQYEVTLEPEGGRDGSRSVAIRSRRDEPTGYVSLLRWIDAAPYRGERIRLSAWVAPEEVAGKGGLWLRVDHPNGRRILAFDNMETRPIRGTSDWRRHELVLDVSSIADRIFYGAILDGTGRLRVDGFEIETVGREVAATDMIRQAPGPENLDFEQASLAEGLR